MSLIFKLKVLLASIFLSQACSPPLRYCPIQAAPDTTELMAKVRLLFETDNIKVGLPSKTIAKVSVNYFVRFIFNKNDGDVEELYLKLKCNGKLIAIEYRKFDDAGLYYLQIN